MRFAAGRGPAVTSTQRDSGRAPSCTPWTRQAGSTTINVNWLLSMVLMQEQAVAGTKETSLGNNDLCQGCAQPPVERRRHAHRVCLWEVAGPSGGCRARRLCHSRDTDRAHSHPEGFGSRGEAGADRSCSHRRRGVRLGGSAPSGCIRHTWASAGCYPLLGSEVWAGSEPAPLQLRRYRKASHS